MYLDHADLQQSQKPSMGKWHLLRNPTEHKNDGFLCNKQCKQIQCISARQK